MAYNNRLDYRDMEKLLRTIPDNEPVFLFRAQDIYAAKVLRFYAELVTANGGDPNIVESTLAQAERMDAWPKKKEPTYDPNKK